MTVVGASQDASDGVAQQLTLQRAASLFIANAERSQKGLETMLTRTAEIAESVCRANAVLTEELTKLRESTSKERHEFMREEGKQVRMNALLEQLAPLLSLAGGVISQGVADWMDAKSKANPASNSISNEASRDKALTKNETICEPAAVAVESPGETDSRESFVTRPSSGIVGTEIPKADARGCGEGNIVVSVGRSSALNKKTTPSGKRDGRKKKTK
jgi:hypothetical protein